MRKNTKHRTACLLLHRSLSSFSRLTLLQISVPAAATILALEYLFPTNNWEKGLAPGNSQVVRFLSPTTTALFFPASLLQCNITTPTPTLFLWRTTSTLVPYSAHFSSLSPDNKLFDVSGKIFLHTHTAVKWEKNEGVTRCVERKEGERKKGRRRKRRE